MTRFTRSGNGKYVVQSKSYDMLIGTRAQVWHGTAFKTSGGLTKTHLLQNKNGRIVSRSKHSQAKKDNRLVKSGYGTKKGTFGYVKLSKGKSKRGGAADSTLANSNVMKAAVVSQAANNANSSGSPNNTAAKLAVASQISANNANSSVGKRGGGSVTNSDASKMVAPTSKMGATKGGRRRKGTKKMRGGMLPLSPHTYSGKGVGTSGVDLQFIAGNAG